MQKMELNLPPDFKGNEIIYRTGSAAPIEQLPLMETIEGDINTVASFVKKRYPCPSTPESLGLQFIDRDRAIVTVDADNFAITLELDPEHPRGTTVKGKLSLSPDLLKFKINTQTAFNRDELVKLIRFNKVWFADRQQADTLEKAYMVFNAEINTKVSKESDLRGNLENSLKKTVNTSVPESFTLNLPVFKGQKKRSFPVRILIETTDASVRFYLESVELSDLIQIESEQILNEQLRHCEDFVVVWK